MSNKEKRGFETATKQLLHLVTHALYSNKEVFLRELVSNAADAEDKLRFAALDDGKLYENDPDLKIEIEFNKDKKTITVRDNGIGMTREDAVEHLGTIAKSGTKDFLSKLSGDQAKDSKLIGQFGVGFYSAFIVADKVTVNSRKAGEAADKAVRWMSDGSGEYEIEDISKEARGTEIILELKKEEDEFLDEFRLRNIITKYSDYVDVPINMQKTITETDEKDKEKKTEKTVWEQVNRGKALWTMPKSQIKEEEFKEFYKHISHDFVDPTSWSLNKVEGKQEYASLLYIPSKAPFDMWDRDHSRGLKLYVRRVFIMDDAEQFLPSYLRFVKGLVDSQDLPLNVSREVLQSNKVVEGIKSGVVKRVLSMLENLAKDAEKYQTFWDAFGRVVKEGPGEDFANRERIAKLLRFSTTHEDNEKQTISLADYVSRMKPEQKGIYYVTAETFNAAKHSPHLEVFRKKGIEVLLLTDNVDEWLMSHLTEFDGKSFQSITKGDLDLGDLDDKPSEEEKKQEEDEFKSLLEHMKKQLESKVSEVRITHRLTDSPACLVVGDNDMSANLQRIMEAAGQQSMASKPILEINPKHAIIGRLKGEADDDQFNEWTEILFDQALLAEGGKLNDPATFVKRLNKMLLALV
jgi:molecular chaperone HtpG